MIDKLKELFRNIYYSDDRKGRSNKIKYLIIIALIGLLFIFIGNSFTTKSTEEKDDNNKIIEQEVEEAMSKDSPTDTNVEDLEASYEKELQRMLENIQGVSEVEVMVNLESTNVKVYDKNLIKGKQTTDESDKNGGIRKVEDNTEETQIVLVRQGDQEVPLLIQTKKPEVRGVFVVAKGVDHATVKMWVIESVAKVLDVPKHKVSVMPKS